MKSRNKGKCSQPWETESGIFENWMRNTQRRIPIQEIGRFEIFVRLSAIFETNWIPHEKNSIGSRVFVIAGLGEKQIRCKVKFAVHVFINGALIYQIKYKTKKT